MAHHPRHHEQAQHQAPEGSRCRGTRMPQAEKSVVHTFCLPMTVADNRSWYRPPKPSVKHVDIPAFQPPQDQGPKGPTIGANEGGCN